MAEYLAENSRLRQLSRRYAEAQLSLDDYRAARREILEALESGRPQTAMEPEPTIREAFVAAAVDMHQPNGSTVLYKTMPPQVPVSSAADCVPAAVEAATWDRHTQVLAIVLGAALLIALVALFYVFIL